MGLRRRGSAAAVWMAGLALLLPACQAAPTPIVPPPSPSPSSTTPTPTPTRTPLPLDFTGPGAAQVMIDRLLADAGSNRLIMVEVTTNAVTVNVLPGADSEPVAWAYRDGKEQEVASDLEYVDQAVFDIGRFDVSDVGALFRQAATISGSTQNQSLHIVDFSGGRVVMAVTTNPESRTVFFEADGSPLPEFDYQTLAGVAAGLNAVTSGRSTVQAFGVGPATGAWVDYPGPDKTTIRRQRTAKVPVTTTSREESLDLPAFAVSQVDPTAIWDVVLRALQDKELAVGQDWSVTVDARGDRGQPRMYFTFGLVNRITDMTGRDVVAS